MIIVQTEDHLGRPQEEDTLGIAAGDFNSDRYENLIFIGIDRKGDFFFINRPEKIYEFKWERWKEWQPVLQPFTFHCFRVEGYRTGTQSKHGFWPVEHICEFPGIRMARIFNRHYLERWQHFHTESTDVITDETRDFIHRMKNYFSEVLSSLIDFVADESADYFANSVTKEQIEWALAVHNSPDTFNIYNHLDNAPWIDQYLDWLHNEAEKA